MLGMQAIAPPPKKFGLDHPNYYCLKSPKPIKTLNSNLRFFSCNEGFRTLPTSNQVYDE